MATNYELQEAELSCPICFEDYDQYKKHRQPKLLMCLHTFCYGCIKAIRKLDGSLMCSICRTTHHVNKISDLYDNYVVFDYLRLKQELEDEKFACKLSEEFLEQDRRESDPSVTTPTDESEASTTEITTVINDSTCVCEHPSDIDENSPRDLYLLPPPLDSTRVDLEESSTTGFNPIAHEVSEDDSEENTFANEDSGESSSSTSTDRDSDDDSDDDSETNFSEGYSAQEDLNETSDASVEEQDESVIIISNEPQVVCRDGSTRTSVTTNEGGCSSKSYPIQSRSPQEEGGDDWTPDSEEEEEETEHTDVAIFDLSNPLRWSPRANNIRTPDHHIRIAQTRVQQPPEDCCLQ